MANISGVVQCAKHNTSYISSGIASLDSLFGGGLAIGSLVVIEEDSELLYSSIITKCFLAEGILSEQKVCLLIADEQPDIFMKNLPAEAISRTEPNPETNPDDSEQLDIAWRYAKTKGTSNSGESLVGSFIGHKLDISRSLDTDAFIRSSSFSAIGYKEFLSFHSCTDALMVALEKAKYAVDSSNSSVLRIVLPGFGSPAWGVPETQVLNYSRPDLSLSLTRLRVLVRASQAVALVTVQSQLFSEAPGLRERLCNLADYCFQMKSFAASDREANPVYKEYRGTFRILKLPIFNGTCPVHRPETLDLAFKVRAQNFIIEPLCLPPDLSDSASRTMTRGDARSGSGCGSGPRSAVDF